MLYRIHRMREAARESFRWSAHTAGKAILKPKDYEPDTEIEAPTPYAAWKLLAAQNTPLNPGDVLETKNESGGSQEMVVAKYIGFEPAEWFVPVPKTDSMSVDTASISE